MQSMRILVLGPEGTGRNALEETLTRLGYVVMGAEARADRPTPASGDVVMLDLRDEGADWQPMADALHADQRPMMIICDRPRRLVRTLSGRPAGTMLLTGAESDAGYKVALAVCEALQPERPGAPRAARGGQRRSTGRARGGVMRAAARLRGHPGWAEAGVSRSVRGPAGPRRSACERREPQERGDGVLELLGAIAAAVGHARAQAL